MTKSEQPTDSPANEAFVIAIKILVGIMAIAVVVGILTNPIVAPLLLSIGFLGLLFEVKTAGFGFGGIAGLTALALFFGAHLIVGLAGW